MGEGTAWRDNQPKLGESLRDEIKRLKRERDEWRDKAIFSGTALHDAYKALCGENDKEKAFMVLRDAIVSLQPNQ